MKKSIETLAVELADVKKLAKILGVTTAAIYKVPRESRQFSAVCATQMELMIGDKRITRKTLRPNDWALTWPELVKDKR
jgi:DNA-binding transcriptional regulator YdaS (Cro superfamily)